MLSIPVCLFVWCWQDSVWHAQLHCTRNHPASRSQLRSGCLVHRMHYVRIVAV